MRRGLVESRQSAQRLIADRKVLVNGSFALKTAAMVAPDDQIVIKSDGPAFVSRSGLKLAEALDAFDVDPRDLCCLDVGSSTGGFTDCLLQRRAARVTAVDVGTNQLHERIRSDSRVTVLERTDVRDLPKSYPDARDFQLAVVDVSFISLSHVVPTVGELLADGGRLLALIKPQFEAGRQEASRGRGVITDPAIWIRTVHEVLDVAHTAGLGFVGLMPCSTRGAKGNVEFMTLLDQNGRTIRVGDPEIDRIVRATGGQVSPLSTDC